MNRKSLQWMSRILIAMGGVTALTVGFGVNQAQATVPICSEGEVVFKVPGAYSTVLEEGKTVTIDTGLVVPVGKSAYLTTYFSWGGYLDSFLALNGPAQTWRVVLGSGASGYTADPADGADNFLVKGSFQATLAGTGGTLVIEHSSVQSPTGVSGANAIYPTGFCYTLKDAPTTTTSTTTSTTSTTTTSTTTTTTPTTVAPTTLPPTTLAPTTTVTVPPSIVPPASTVPALTAAPTTTTSAPAATTAPTTAAPAPSVSVAGVTVVQTTIAAAPAAQVNAGDLAYTGSSTTGLNVLAAVLIGLGLTLLAMSRRLDPSR